MIAVAFDQAEARDPGHLRLWTVLVDGACHQLDLIHAETRRRDVTVHVLIDFVHVSEYAWARWRRTLPTCSGISKLAAHHRFRIRP
ncbi:hypothetical protein [Streptomyces sp. CL12-4]|uniref:hypothetical protein n=1 Tax=Streptomyces sp. CL12-4 TaxID=2810306 RepID=UPI001FDCBD87|nr:hypothetical protein [Streptomyces sp. CL12-4]